MSFVQQVADAVGTAPLRALDDLSRSIWQGLAAGALDDDDAQRLAEAIHARRIAAKAASESTSGRSAPRSPYPGRKPQRPPLRPLAIERRRRLASSGPLPPALAAKFTTSQLAVLRIIGDEVRAKGQCDRTIAEIAARAGTCRTVAKDAIREAARLGLLAVEERRQPGRKNLPNMLRIVSREWAAWLTRGAKGSGVVNPAPTDKPLKTKGSAAEPSKGWRRGEAEEVMRTRRDSSGRKQASCR